MIPVGWLAPGDQWDTTLVADLLGGKLYEHGLKTRNWEGYPRTGGAVIVCPSRYWAGHEAKISEALSFYSWCLFIATSDEEATFNLKAVEHPNIRFWCQTPRKDKEYPEGTRFLGVGYTPHLRDLPADPPLKDLHVFLSCQRTHVRREQAFQALEDVHCFKKYVIPTQGFTQGISPEAYRDSMVEARVAPCPSGAVSVDTFRFWEALAAHTIPIADAVSPVDGETQYWERLFGEVPFPAVTDYAWLPKLVEKALGQWPENANRITAWWMRQKRQYALDLVADLRGLGAL